MTASQEPTARKAAIPLYRIYADLDRAEARVRELEEALRVEQRELIRQICDEVAFRNRIVKLWKASTRAALKGAKP